MTLSLGDRRWVKLGDRILEFLFLDQVSTKNGVGVWLLVDPADPVEGELVMAGSTQLKPVVAKPPGRCYVVDSTAPPMQSLVGSKGRPIAAPTVSTEVLQAFLESQTSRQSESGLEVLPAANVQAQEKTPEDTQTQILAMMYQFGDQLSSLQGRVKNVEMNPRELAGTSDRRPGITFGAGQGFSEAEDDDIAAAATELRELRSEVRRVTGSPAIVPSTAPPSRAGDDLDVPPSRQAPPPARQPRESAELPAREKLYLARSSR